MNSKLYIIPGAQEIIKTGLDNENKPIRFTRDFKEIDTSKVRIQDLNYNCCLSQVSGDEICNQDLFWEQFSNFIKNKVESDINNNFLLVTHHNRLKHTILNDIISDKSNYGFANCSCIRIYYDKNKWNIQIIFEGYPDEIKYNYFKNGKLNKSKNGIRKNLQESIIHKYLIDIYTKTNIYIIRHGNSMHNRPIKINNQSIKSYFIREYDSPLTPLGIYQTSQLREYLTLNNYFNNSKNYFCVSTLNRSQHTALNLIPNLKDITRLHFLDLYFGKLMLRRIEKYFSIFNILIMLNKFYYLKHDKNIINELYTIISKYNYYKM